MANCSVLEAHQKPTDKPTRRIKRSGGHSLVRQQKADWIVENVLLIMRAEMPATSCVSCRNYEHKSARYIPDQMPWAELPGVKFVDPISKTATQNQAVRRRFFVMAANRIAQ